MQVPRFRCALGRVSNTTSIGTCRTSYITRLAYKERPRKIPSTMADQNHATYALLQPPSFDVIPDTDIRLGSIHPRTSTRPRRPDTKRILNRSSRVDVPPALLRTRHDPSVTLSSDQLRSGGAGIKAQSSLLPVLGGAVNGEGSSSTILHIHAEEVDTHWFLPDDAYFEEALKGAAVRKQLFDFRAPSVFLVTGVKIAQKAKIVTGRKKDGGGDLGPEVDLTGFGIPVQVGANIKAKFKDHGLVVVEKKEPFVLAFETRRVRVKKKGFTEEDFNRFAVLDDEPDVDIRVAALKDQVDFDETANEVDDEE